MSEDTQPRWEWKAAVGVPTMLWNGAMISAIAFWGNPQNPLLQNIVADCFLLSGVVLVGLGIVPAVVDTFASYFKK